jgi:hypothetical protein
MKFIRIYALGVITLFSVGMIISCTKSFDEKTVQQTNFNSSTLAQVYVATVNAARNYVYVDTKPVTGALLVTGSVFPSSGSGYAFNVASGVRAFLIRDTLGTSTQVPLSFAENMQVGRNHTIFTYDTITAPKQKTVISDIVLPSGSTTTSRLRFANFVYSPFAIPAFDIYSTRTRTTIFTNVQVTDVTNFISYPAGVADTFLIRPTGTTTNLQNFTPASPPTVPAIVYSDLRAILTPTAGRSYTLIFRGGYRVTSTAATAATVRTLTSFINF